MIVVLRQTMMLENNSRAMLRHKDHNMVFASSRVTAIAPLFEARSLLSKYSHLISLFEVRIYRPSYKKVDITPKTITIFV